jgi:hypothetical protein
MWSRVLPDLIPLLSQQLGQPDGGGLDIVVGARGERFHIPSLSQQLG